MDKIRCIIVDDDALSRDRVSAYCEILPFVDLVQSFSTPQNFLELLPSQKFDVCLLGLRMAGVTGIDVVQQLGGQSVIFIAGEEDMLKDALNLSPIDIVLKPVESQRLSDALSKAYHQLNGQRQKHRNGKECEMLSVEGIRGKVKFRLADILYIHSDKDDPRHKYVITRDGNTQRVMDCKFEKLISVAHNLVRVNCSEAVSLELVKSYGSSTVVIEDFATKNGGTKELMLNRTFRKEFKGRIEAW